MAHQEFCQRRRTGERDRRHRLWFCTELQHCAVPSLRAMGKARIAGRGRSPSFQGAVGETQGKASESREKARCRPQGWAKVTDPQQADGRVTILSSSRRVSSNGHLVHHLSMQRDQATHVLMGRSASNATFSRNAKIWEMAFVGSTERKKKRSRHV